MLDDGVGSLGVTRIEETVDVAEVDFESECEAVVDALSPSEDSAALVAEEGDMSVVVDNEPFGLEVEEIEVIVDPPVSNSSATVRLIQKHVMRMARALKLIEGTIMVAIT